MKVSLTLALLSLAFAFVSASAGEDGITTREIHAALRTVHENLDSEILTLAEEYVSLKRTAPNDEFKHPVTMRVYSKHLQSLAKIKIRLSQIFFPDGRVPQNINVHEACKKMITILKKRGSTTKPAKAQRMNAERLARLERGSELTTKRAKPQRTNAQPICFGERLADDSTIREIHAALRTVDDPEILTLAEEYVSLQRKFMKPNISMVGFDNLIQRQKEIQERLFHSDDIPCNLRKIFHPKCEGDSEVSGEGTVKTDGIKKVIAILKQYAA